MILEFTAWAALHKDRTGGLSGFFSSQQGRATWGQESARHIRSQIRGADRGAPAQQSRLIQDMLFLCLAHQYDEQQNALHGDLASMASLEHRFGQILGEPEEEKEALKPASIGQRYAGAFDPGLYMTERRIDAWARLAAACPVAEIVYITTSRSVWESLCERLPDASTVLSGYSAAGNDTIEWPPVWASFFSEVSRARDPFAFSDRLPSTVAGHQSGWALTLHAVAGCPPTRVLSRLLKTTPESTASDSASSAPVNTLLGYLQIDPDSFSERPAE
jgi:hypothetical protein